MFEVQNFLPDAGFRSWHYLVKAGNSHRNLIFADRVFWHGDNAVDMFSESVGSNLRQS
jgi:hypothetical protein